MLVSLPIIVAWGLPSSWLSPIGNFIFNPLISLFLFVSSIAFFSELIGLPHTWCNWLLEQLTAGWHWLFQLAPTQVLYGFHAVPWWLLSIISLVTFASVMHPGMRYPWYRLSGLMILFILSMAIIRAHEPSFLITALPCNRGSITIIKTNNTTIVIDPGYIGSRLSAPSWISYRFMPYLIAQTGSLTIDHLMLLKPNTLTCDAIDTLLDAGYVHHIYMPTLTGELTGSLRRSFGKLYTHIKERNIPFIRFTDKESTLDISTTSFCIKPDGIKKYQTITYPHITMHATIGSQQITIIGR